MIEILLATYNGEKYLEEQIQSLIDQTYKDIRILIRDDNSMDNTVPLIKDLEKRYPGKVIYVQDNEECGSAKANFMALLKHATAEYVMFCDQDDVWLPDKVQDMFDEMKRQEKEFCGPLLIYSDYISVDKNLKPLNENKKNSQVYNPKLDLNHLLVQNYINGCCMIVNKNLYEKTLVYREEMLMHDWWIAIYAATFGKIVHMNKSLMYYRQHGDNVVGSVDIRSLQYVKIKLMSKDTKKANMLYIQQAAAFYEEYEKEMEVWQKEVIKAFLEIPNLTKISRIMNLRRGKYLKSTMLRRIGQYFYI